MTVILLSLIRRKKKWIKIDNKKKTAKRGRVFCLDFSCRQVLQLEELRRIEREWRNV